MDEAPLDTLAYDKMVEDALRGVLRQALKITERQGLPGEHHFYITFRTDHPGVSMPERLRAQHKELMTIVLQHQFWDLEVTDEWFAVSLSFSGVRSRLEVPFEAVSAFTDPHATFGLQFNAVMGAGLDDDDADFDEDGDEDGDDASGTVSDAGTDRTTADAGDDAGSKPAGETGKVVTLDAFRKKT